jgi:hypothetical protein
MLNEQLREFRLAKLSPEHLALNKALSTDITIGKTLDQVAAAAGITPNLAERRLSALVDEGLVKRCVVYIAL